MSHDQPRIDWAALAEIFLHPVKRQIIEALRRAGKPMSASDLQLVLDGGLLLDRLDYHLKSLAVVGVLEAQERQPGRRAKTKTPYLLVSSFLIRDAS